MIKSNNCDGKINWKNHYQRYKTYIYFSINLKPLFLSNSADSHHNPSVTGAVWKEEGSLCRTQMCYKNNISWRVEMLRIGFKSAKFNKFWTTAHFNSDFVCSSSIICVSLEVSTCLKIVKIPFMGAAQPLNNPGYHRGLPVDKNQGAVVLSDTELHFCWQIHDLELSQVLLSLFHLSAPWAVEAEFTPWWNELLSLNMKWVTSLYSSPSKSR